MKNNEINKENEYKELFDEFINSSEDKLYSKQEVKKIIEAHMLKNVFTTLEENESNSKPRNILVTTKNLSIRIFNVKSLVNFFLTYLFYVGFLLLILNFVYKDLIQDKYTVFIVAFAFSLVDKLVKPLLFIADLLTFTIHKVGLITIMIYATIFFVISNTLSQISSTVSIEKSLVVGIIVLFLTFIYEFIKRDSFFKTKYMEDDEIGSDFDE